MSDETRDVRKPEDRDLEDLPREDFVALLGLVADEIEKKGVSGATLREAARRLREEPEREAHRESPEREAFREGYGYGFAAGELGASYHGSCDTMNADEAWRDSDARTALSDQDDYDCQGGAACAAAWAAAWDAATERLGLYLEHGEAAAEELVPDIREIIEEADDE